MISYYYYYYFERGERERERVLWYVLHFFATSFNMVSEIHAFCKESQGKNILFFKNNALLKDVVQKKKKHLDSLVEFCIDLWIGQSY